MTRELNTLLKRILKKLEISRKLISIGVFITMAIMTLSGCNRVPYTDVTLNITRIDLPEIFNIDKVVYMGNDTAFAAGGIKNIKGLIYMTTDGGNTWVKRYSNEKASINDLVFYNDKYGFACGDSMLLLKTIDGGLTWQEHAFLNLPYEEYRVPFNSVFVFDSLALFLAGGEHYFKGLTSYSETGAYPWYHTSFDNEIRDALFIDNNFGILASYGQVFITEDGGETFSNLELGDEYFYDIEAYDGKLWLLGRYGQLLCSNDNFMSWYQIVKFSKPTLRDLWMSDNVCYVCGDLGAFYLSRDRGQNWNQSDGFLGKNLNSISVNPLGETMIGSDEGIIFIIDRRRASP
ncbi:MAG TPA: hypothetical protein PLM49_01200 [Bacteroidales bacterium]|nr:hypothetical protein [Bacteroidales bacterium]